MENENFRILLADDDESDRFLFEKAIRELDIKHSIQTVCNGMELMEYLTKNTILPDFIFLDLNMPRKNGIECLKEIRSTEKFKNISIAIYSTSGTEKDISETFLNGANVYIKKPNNFASFKRLICTAIKTAVLHQDESFNRENFMLSI